MAQTTNSLPPVAHIILEREGQILLIKRPNDNRYNGRYDLPADFCNSTEATTSAAVRAAKEEMDVNIDLADMEFAVLTHGLHPDRTEHYDFYFRASRWTGEPRLTSLHRGTEAGWFHLDQLPADLTPRTELGLQVAMGGIPYVEYGFDESSPLPEKLGHEYLGET